MMRWILGFTLVVSSPVWAQTDTPAKPKTPPSGTGQDGAAAKEWMYGVDTTHSMALFCVKHLGAGLFYGRFNGVEGGFNFTPGHDANPLEVEIAIDAGSVDTGSRRLDGHIKSADFLDHENHAKMTFKSSSSKKLSDSEFEVMGDLQIRGVTKPITVKVTKTGSRAGQRGNRIGFKAEFSIKRSEYQVMYGVENGSVGDETEIIIAVEAIEGAGRDRGGRGRRGGRDLVAELMSHDKNGDEKIEKSELPERMQRVFSRLDRDGDGFITKTEIEEGQKRRGSGRGGR